MDNNLKILNNKLEEFISRYYFFKILRGGMMLFGLFILVLLIQSAIEYFNYLNTTTKTILFFLTSLLTFFLIIIYFIIPAAALLKIRKPITYSKAAEIVSMHFSNIQDKLINTLELGELLKRDIKFQELLVASINQRIETITPLPFKNALNFKLIKKNLLFFTISVFCLLIVFAFNSKVLTEGTIRLINFSTYYEREAPFKFEINEKSLVCEKNKNYTLELRVTGDYIPENVYINVGGNLFLMQKDKIKGKYFFIFRNVNNSFDFNFSADNFNSRQYLLNVLPAPILKGFNMFIVPPSYTGVEPFKVVNTGDCTVPAGSTIKWEMKTLNVDYLSILFQTDTVKMSANGINFSYSKQVREPISYSIILKNKYFQKNENLNYKIAVIKDEFPEIETRQVEDSSKLGAYYFMLNIKDDYGFHDLNFVRRIMNSDSSDNSIIQKIAINPNNRNQDQFFYFDFNHVDSTSDGSIIEYYFEVRDNDYLNSFKPTRSTVKVFKLLDRDEIRNQIEEYDKSRDKALSKSKELTKEIKKEISEFKKKEMSDQLTDWDKKNFLKSISDKQKELDKFVKEMLEQNKKSNQANDQFYDEQKKIDEKQKQIQELLDQILDDELKKLLKEIQDLSEKFNPKEFEKLKEKLDFSYNNLEKKLDRSIELLKRYQVEENVMKLSEDLQKLSDNEHSLNENMNELKKKDELINKQKDIKSEFEKLNQDYKETLEKNKDLQSPYDIEKFDDEFKNINNGLEELNKETPGGAKNKLKKMQEKTSQQMQELAKNMEKMFNEMEMQSIDLNLGDLRQIIDNLSTFSFDEEENYNNTNKTLQSNPSFPALIKKQSEISDDFSIIADSLNSLMTKVPQMDQLLVKEMESINFNLKKGNELMEQRNRREAMKFQRYILNSSNTLALYLEELKNQMEKQKQGSGSGKSKKGKQDEAMQNLKQQQKKLKEELEKLLEQMKNGSGKPNDDKMSEQIVKTLAEQEIFNKMLQEMQNQKGISPESDKKLKEIKQLSDQNIQELINKKISPELINRNQKILTRLLESEKAEKEREQENKRESKEGVKKDMDVPEELKESLKNENKYRETLQKSNLNLKNYYKNISNDYFRIINQ
jgi:hypothetical protein